MSVEVDNKSDYIRATPHQSSRLRSLRFFHYKFALGLLIFLGLTAWSLTHQISFAPPPEGSRSIALREIAKSQVLPVDVDITTEFNGSYRSVFGDGFLSPEPNGIWISALGSELIFALNTIRKAPFELIIEFAPLLGPSRPQRTLTVTSTGASNSKVLRGPGRISVVLSQVGRQVVSVTCDSLDSPRSLRVGPDYTQLCAKIVFLRIAAT